MAPAETTHTMRKKCAPHRRLSTRATDSTHKSEHAQQCAERARVRPNPDRKENAGRRPQTAHRSPDHLSSSASVDPPALPAHRHSAGTEPQTRPEPSMEAASPYADASSRFSEVERPAAPQV